MNRIDFMSRLSFLLSDIPENERNEAIQYYEDYLNDAGVENEEEVLEALGTPEALAASIREGLKEDNEQQGEFSERGFSERAVRTENVVARRENGQKRQYGAENGAGGGKGMKGPGAAQSNGGQDDLDSRYRGGRKKKGMSGGMLALIVILCILAVPVALPVVLTLAIVVVVLAFVAVLLAVIFLFVGIICVVAGVISFAGAIAKLFVYPAGAVLMVGISLFTIGIGILLTIAIGWVVSRFFPKAFRALTDLVARLFHRKGGQKA
ncbi:MAG: DUF1700 domain-containing protein [Eubacteriales bacterium]|nr:DUF1700 domain-containing protein [Eubacteriales bacterium]